MFGGGVVGVGGVGGVDVDVDVCWVARGCVL